MPMTSAPQRISRVRREYNGWVGNETLEDYALRFAPRSFRKWSEARVAITALGSVSFLALEAIGAAIYINYGFSNALLAILTVGLVVFLTGLPISYYAAKYNVDMDLLARGAGFGYVGSTITSLIYASFTFIFFALEAAIMAVALKLAFGLPLWLAYIACSLIVIPLVTHGVTFISRMQYLTLLPWLALMLLPYVCILGQDTQILHDWSTYQGRNSSTNEFQALAFGCAATVSFSLVAQIGEQVDFLRFLPENNGRNNARWWGAVLLSGPGWIILGVLKQIGGTLLAFLTLQNQIQPSQASDPTQMYLLAYGTVFSDPRTALAVTTAFVILSQLKINVTNAYAGSLAWSNFFSRLTHSHPGRVVWLVFNVTIALLLMQLGLIGALERVLGLYACLALAWVGALVADLVVNKPLGWSPAGIEFRRAYLYNFNPVGVVATLSAALLSVMAYAGLFGSYAQAFAPFIALCTAFCTAPLIAFLTQGRYYTARPVPPQASTASVAACCICDTTFEHEDTADCPAYGGTICSLCCTLDARCQDLCKKAPTPLRSHARHDPHARKPPSGSRRRLLDYGATFVLLAGTLTGVILATRHQVLQSLGQPTDLWSIDSSDPVLFALWMTLLVCTGIATWWLVLTRESRTVAQEESNRQTHLLLQEIDEHQKTDAKLIKAKQQAEAANIAKSRFLAGMSHELRSPLNSILGYAQLLKAGNLRPAQRHDAVEIILQSSEHLLTLIDDILDLARIEAGKFRLNPREIDFPAFLRQLVNMFRGQAASKGLHFVTEFDGRLPEHVRIDERRLRQIVINLLSNAVKYTQAGTVTLNVRYSGSSVTIRVTDTGPGIAAPDLDRIFEPFQRVTSQDEPRADGTGLGLPICKLLVHQMGGELTVETTPGNGATFQVRMFLPSVAGPLSPSTPAHTITGYYGPRRRILVTDDQKEHRTMVATMLTRVGFEVIHANYGLECLARARELKPDLILLDLIMPGLDGLEVARTLGQRDNWQGPVIAVSASAFEEHRERCLAAGCSGFIAKPVQLPILMGMLQQHLGLTWIQTPEPAVVNNVAASDSAPPQRYIEALYEFARIGYVKGIHQSAHSLQQEHPAHSEFSRRVLDLAKGFRIAELIDLLEHCRTKEPDHGQSR